MDSTPNAEQRDPTEGLPAEITHLAVDVDKYPDPDISDDKLPADEMQEKVEGELRIEISQCETFIDQDLSLDRAKATRYYRGDDFGDEEEGRSQIVMPIVRDVIRASLPGLMKTFFGGQNVVEFSAAGNSPNSDDAQQASDATAAVNHVILNQNDGWITFYGVFKDALRGRTGWMTWWVDESPKVKARTYTGVSEEQLQAYASVQEMEEDVQVLSREQVGTQPDPNAQQQPPQMDPATGQPMPAPPPQQVPVYQYKIRVISRKPQKRYCVDSVPPEEVIYSRESASIDGHRRPRLIGRRRMVTQSYCIGLGIAEEFVEANGGMESALTMNQERLARQPFQSAFGPGNFEGTDDQRFVTLYDVYYYVDQDQDGVSELRHIIALGDQAKIWSNEYADDVPLALFCPDPEPHLMVGLSQADSLMDLQVMWSHVMRDVLDSLKLSIFPRTAYVEGQANVDDVLNTEMGGAIRMRAPGMVTPFTHEFAGQKAFPLFDVFDQIQERRTGIGRGSMGMDGSALQSTTAGAAAASISASQQMVELVARIFAETGMKRVFAGVLRMLRENQDHEMQFRLNGHDYKVMPSAWDDLDVSIDTGLGLGSEQNKLAALTQHATDLQGTFSSMGMDNPLGSLTEYYNTKKKILEIAGIRDVQRYLREPVTAQKNGAKIQSPTSPEQTVADAEVKIKGRMEDRETLKIILTDDREREKLIADVELRAADIEGKYGTQVDVAHIRALMAREQQQSEALLAAQPQPVGNAPPSGATSGPAQ
jgi:hypothetical protein